MLLVKKLKISGVYAIISIYVYAEKKGVIVMCGICGFTGQLENRENVLQKMTDIITHRGPDSDGAYIDDYIAMGFKRLSIIDIEQGDQPIYNETKNLILTFNGEIYNYKDLKSELTSLGHTFSTNSDSEVIVHGFEEWDEDVVLHLRGMFAFAIYNKETKAIYMARDYFGIKPLHYTSIGDDFCYASEIKSILEHPKFEKIFNEKALDAYLSFQYCPQPMTFFKNVFCLMPGHFLWYRDGVIETQRYFEAKFKPNNEMTEDEAIDRIEAVFEDSVNAHKISDVEVGCFLSSGVDSSYVSSYFKGQKTFTVGFDYGDKYNEISWAKNFAEEAGVQHYSKMISGEEFWAAVPKVQYHMDQPLADPSCIALYFVAKLASEQVKVVLSGEGADELFGGYTCYNDPRVFKWYQKICPYFLRRAIGAICKKLPDIKGRDYLIRAIHPIEKRYIGNAYMYDKKQKEQILKDPSIASDPTRLVRRLYTRARRYDDETKMQYIDINTWLIGDILLKADRMSMANSLELRVPFLDKEVYKVAASLPTDLRVNKYNTKYAMRLAAARHINDTTAEKEKLGFPVPTRVWLRDEYYYSVVKDMFMSLTARKFFNTDVLLDYLDEHFIEKEDNSRKIWTIYTFLVWYEIYFGKVELEDLSIEEQAEIEAEEAERERIEKEKREMEEAIKEEEEKTEEPEEQEEEIKETIKEEKKANTPKLSNTENDGATKVFKPFDNEIVNKSQKEIEELFSSSNGDSSYNEMDVIDIPDESVKKISALDDDDIDPDTFFDSLKSRLKENFDDE